MLKENKVYLTKDGLQDLKAELKQLTEVERLSIAERIKTARDMGDISENADYEAAREKQAFVEGRVREIEDILSRVELIDENKKTNSVGVGVTVKVHVDGGEEEFMIVGAPEANPIDKKISHESPLGKALLGKKVGDHVDVEAPMGNLTYTVLSIK
jgi:transcription elongation factor GreA